METKPIHYGFLYDLFVKKPTLQWHRDVDDILLCARYYAKKYRCRTLQDLYRSNSEGEQITFFKKSNGKTYACENIVLCEVLRELHQWEKSSYRRAKVNSEGHRSFHSRILITLFDLVHCCTCRMHFAQ